MYVRLFILAASILVLLPLLQNANAAIQIDPASIYLNDSGNYVPYKLTNNANFASMFTKDGSFVFDKNTCSLSFYNNTDASGTPVIGSDTYTVLASQGNSGIWNPVNIINNAACTVTTSQSQGTVSLQATKSVSGAGIFSVNYTKPAHQKLKITFSATNQNPVWTNYHIGMAENLQVPKIITLGNQTYDLSQYNGTVLSRTWIANHYAQLLQLSSNSYYDMGLGWNNAEQIVIHWINNKASLEIDYIHNTPILAPGNTITVDPGITTDTITAAINTGASTNATQNISITIGSNSNRMLIVAISHLKASFSSSNLNNDVISSVKLGSMSFTKAGNASRYNATAPQSFSSEIWWLASPPTGAQHITITPVTTTQYFMIAGAYSLYNVQQTSPIGVKVTNGTTTNGTTTRTSSISITPTTSNSWVIENIAGFPTTPSGTAAPTNPSDTQAWSTFAVNANTGASQYKTSPTIGSPNKMTWAFNTPTGFKQNEADIVIELRASIRPPNVPSLTHANTLNSTAIQLDWPSVTNAAFYLINYTTPASGTTWTQINQTAITKIINSLTPGTQYAFKVAAGNATGTSTFTPYKSNYTYNVAATSPVISNIKSTQARLSWTNPSPGNLTGGFNIYKVTALGSNYTLVASTSNSTNHYDLTSLLGNREYTAKLATRYGVGTNASGASSNSTTVTFYTIPGTPTGLTITQTAALHPHLSWTQAVDNGTVTGTKIERSTNGGTSWTTIVANTGNSSSTYNDVVSAAGTYTYRVSTIKYGGTSDPSSQATKTIWNSFTVREYHADGITAVYGQAIQANSTSSNNRFPLVSGAVTISGLSGNNNFTAWNSLINFIVGKQYNYNATANHSLNMTTNDYDIDCPSTGTGVDVEVWTNGTNGHRITTFTTPTCFANNTMKWSTKFTANGNDLNSYSTLVYVRAVNATFATKAPLKYNNTLVTTAFTDPYIVSNPVTVGTGLQTKMFNWSMNLTVSPAFTPVNFTVGHISVSGVNPVTAPIKFTTTTINSSATKVTVTFPSTYTMGYQLNFGNEGSSHTYTGLPVTSPSLGLSQSSFTFLNPKNDMVTIKAYDIPTNTTARYILAQPNNQIPFVTQILNFKNGLFGTSAMIGGIDIVSLIILIIAMIGLNRANEVVGAIMMIIIIGVCAYFGLIEWQTTMTAAIALVVLVIVSTTKKLPYS